MQIFPKRTFQTSNLENAEYILIKKYFSYIFKSENNLTLRLILALTGGYISKKISHFIQSGKLSLFATLLLKDREPAI